MTVQVMADDKLTEKKDKNVNEPIQFYSSKARQPYEIVVNQVQKDLIVGYRLAYSTLYRDKDLDGVLTTYNPDADYARKVKSVMRQIAPNE